MTLWNLHREKRNPDGNHKIIHIDTRGSHINKLYQPDIEVIGDISDALTRILKDVDRQKKINGLNR